MSESFQKYENGGSQLYGRLKIQGPILTFQRRKGIEQQDQSILYHPAAARRYHLQRSRKLLSADPGYDRIVRHQGGFLHHYQVDL